MSWSYGNIRWTLPFKSLNNTDCRVDIYKRGYSGTSVTTLIGQANPFYWQENNDESLLNVIRTKTGYLNVVETSSGLLSDLAPETDTDHYVEFYYGTTLYFNGFMQAQNFENDWTSSPRRMSFPVQSPLSLIYGMKFETPAEPSFVKLAAVLKEACDGLQANIGYVIFPSGYRDDMTLSLYINTLVYSPYNDEYQCAASSTEPLFKARNYGEFIEGLCNCFGLVAHDLPGYLVFSRFDYLKNYEKWDVQYMNGGLYHPQTYEDGDTLLDMRSLNVKSSNNKESVVLPVHKIELDYDGEFYVEQEMEITMGKVTDSYHGTIDEEDQVVFSPAIDISVPSSLLQTSYHALPSSVRGVWLLAAGNGLKRMVLVDERGGGYSSSQEILTWTVYIPPRNMSYFNIAVMLSRGDDINETESSDVEIGIMVANAGKYYNASTSAWESSPTINAVTGTDGLHELTVGGEPDNISPLQVTLYMGNMGSFPNSLYLIESVRLRYDQGQLGQYVTKLPDEVRKLTSDNGSPVTETVNQLFNVATYNDNSLSKGGMNWFDENVVCEYEYMFISQNRLQVDLQLFAMEPYDYTRLVQFYIDAWRWRIISITCEPWNDVMNVTMHRSPTIE